MSCTYETSSNTLNKYPRIMNLKQFLFITDWDLQKNDKDRKVFLFPTPSFPYY